MITAVLIAYNNDTHIAEAVQSALRQTKAFDRIIVVDDGSTDQTRPMLREFAERHDRLDVIFHDENQGPGGARNTGLDQVTTEYFCFLDGDDVFFDDCCEKMQKACAEEDADFWAFNGLALRENSSNRRIVGRVTSTVLTSLDERQSALNWVTYPWNKLYRTAFIRQHNIRFPKGRYEDVPWCVACTLSARKIVGRDEPVVHYRMHGDSLLKRPSISHIDILDQWQRATDFTERMFGDAEIVEEERFIHLMHVVRSGRIPDARIPDYVDRVLDICGPLPYLRAKLTSKKASRSVRYIAKKKWL